MAAKCIFSPKKMCATHVFAIFSAVHDQKMKILVAADS